MNGIRPVTLVLDTSAILEFTRQSLHVGEVLTQVDDEGAAAGLPLACLVEAAQAAVDGDRLDLLVGHAATVVLADDPGSWRMLSATYTLVGSFDSAAAALNALDLDASVLTRRPERYANVDNGTLLIALPN